jgi:hypothetical protein
MSLVANAALRDALKVSGTWSVPGGLEANQEADDVAADPT